MSTYDIARESISQDRFCRVRAKVQTLIDHMAASGKRPESVAVFAGDYKAVRAAVNSRLRKEAKAAERAANLDKPRKQWIKVPAPKAEELTFDGIPLIPNTYTRRRAVKA